MIKPLDRLILMANQIGKAFSLHAPDEAVREIAVHIESFWESRMLARIYAHIDAGGAGLDALPRRALEFLRQKATPKG